MLDKSSKALLAFMNDLPAKAIDLQHDFEYPSIIGDQDAFNALVRFLEADGYLESVMSSHGNRLKVSLSHKGLHWKEFRRHEVIAYLEDKWIDFFALLASVAAIVMSAISLASQFASPPG